MTGHVTMWPPSATVPCSATVTVLVRVVTLPSSTLCPWPSKTRTAPSGAVMSSLNVRVTIGGALSRWAPSPGLVASRMACAEAGPAMAIRKTSARAAVAARRPRVIARQEPRSRRAWEVVVLGRDQVPAAGSAAGGAHRCPALGRSSERRVGRLGLGPKVDDGLLHGLHG